MPERAADAPEPWFPRRPGEPSAAV